MDESSMDQTSFSQVGPSTHSTAQISLVTCDQGEPRLSQKIHGSHVLVITNQTCMECVPKIRLPSKVLTQRQKVTRGCELGSLTSTSNSTLVVEVSLVAMSPVEQNPNCYSQKQKMDPPAREEKRLVL